MVRLFFISLCMSCIWALPPQQTHSKLTAPRIINGDPASPGQFPWQVAIYVEDVSVLWVCSGSIISEEWILTAAHCIIRVIRGHISTGSVNRLLGNITDAYEFIIHEEFNEYYLTNDIGLVKLKFPLQLDANTKPIALASEPTDADVRITVSGWGYTKAGVNELSDTLNYIELVTISNDECREIYNSQIGDGAVCATYDTPELKNPCNGDSGGSAVTNVDTDPVLVGVVSFGGGLGCDQQAPSGYSRVAYYRDWIKNKTGL